MGLTKLASSLFKKVEAGLVKQKMKGYEQLLAEIEKHNPGQATDGEIQERSRKLLEAARAGADLDKLLPEAYALVREAAGRVLGMRHFDVQLQAGMALHDGKLVEMQTGEGKTLAAVLPVYLHALAGKGVHVLTFNDYLARRDANWMGPLYEFLGLHAASVHSGMTHQERQAAYAADVTYLTAKEAGFDFLRDQLCRDPKELIQRPLHMALVDEADSILIDEARLPLVIAGERASVPMELAIRLAELVGRMEEGSDYGTDEHRRHVFLHEFGANRLESFLHCGNLYDEENEHLLTAIHCALHAEALVHRDVDYIVRDGKVQLIDAFTGRVAENRHWPDGIQAAVEAKEGIAHSKGGVILGTITLQHYLNLYSHLCGMTATARTSAEEFREFYDLNVVTIAPNKPNRRMDQRPLIYTHKEAKLKGLVEEIVRVHATGRPVLIGTASVEESFGLSEALQMEGIVHEVLNASNDELEAEIIARAGIRNAVTVSTNMAGRGVDIRLGGGDSKQASEIADLGGLYVLGTNLHESERIDNQLKGRAGRQGDPGSSRFFISLEDELIERFGRSKAIPSDYLRLRQDKPLNVSVIFKRLSHIQRIVQGQNIEIRKNLTRYSEIQEEQRQIFHERRLNILHDSNLPKEEREAWLYHIDRLWAEHLNFVSYLREGIHLESISDKNPFDLFHSELIEAFAQLPEHLEQAVEESLEAWRSGGSEAAALVFPRPTATWTYTINDNFFPDRSVIF